MSPTSSQPTRNIDPLIDRKPLTLQPGMSIRRAAAKLAESRTAAAPVTDEGGALLGLLTQKDCFRPALHASYYQEWKGSVDDFMSAEPMTLPLGIDLVSAADAFLNNPYRSLPVLDGNRLVGMLHREDVFRALVLTS